MASPAPIRVLIVDDHALLRDGLAGYVGRQDDMVVAGEARDGREAIDLHRALRPDVTLLDLQMPVLGGLEALAGIRAETPQARVVVLTTFDGDVQALRALKLGAQGYLLKSGLHEHLGDAIRTVHAGGRHLQPEVAAAVAIAAAGDRVTDREAEVLRLAAEGNANKQIAYLLGVGEETVKSHMRSLLEKLGARDRSHAITIALRRGILEL
ncbi:response regulator [Sphingomonas sp. R1]|uniref:response regulator n=1 Tax=Sphingomonas sp. R1 TaxID=399176 RepID=UPI0022257F82|nr:response regulator transcription factor [Sphingomonas sp. R1]UYY78702.1 response regulator transcription factor [Sphingomonas sp. R1]